MGCKSHTKTLYTMEGTTKIINFFTMFYRSLFLQRLRYLEQLLKMLPDDIESPLCRQWPSCTLRLTETNNLLHKIHRRWRCHKYRLKFDQTARNRMREKVTASFLFKDRKCSYPRRYSKRLGSF